MPVCKGDKWAQLTHGIRACLGAFVAGFIMAWAPIAHDFIANDALKYKVSEYGLFWIHSAFMLGATIGCIPTPFLCQKIGLRKCMLVLIVPAVFGCLLLTYAINVIVLHIGRFILGMTCGSMCIAVPLYTVEIAKDNIRGSVGCLFEEFLLLGVTCAFALGCSVSLFWFNAVSAVIPILYLYISFDIAESPQHLVRLGKKSEALDALISLRGKGVDVSIELAEIVDAYERKKDESLKNAFLQKSMLKALALSSSLMVIRQFGGIIVIFTFWSRMCREAFPNTLSYAFLMLFLGLLMTFSTLISVFTVDTLGRRWFLLITGVIQTINVSIITIYYFIHYIKPEKMVSLGWIPLASACVFCMSFSLGYGPLPWLIMAELFSSNVRLYAATLVAMTNWFSGFIVIASLPYLVDEGGRALAFTLSVLASIAAIAVPVFLPETRGKSAAEIQEYFKKEEPT